MRQAAVKEKQMVYILIILASVVIDQALKMLVISFIGMLGTKSVIPGFLYITCIANDGAAMGILSGKQTLVIAFTAVFMIAIAAVMIRYRKKFHPFLMTALSLTVGGGIGNIIDRIRFNYVIDFIDFRIWPYIFNFADICVVLGCFMIVVYLLFEKKFKKETGTDE